ncbi:MAG: hypothetical protein RMI91_13870 [Gemmatales bacterium]|nr:hypothetical protein [Gemmatales bacterium]
MDKITANQLSCQDHTSKFPPYEQGTLEIEGHRFAYLHRADIHCPDPRAQGRFPSVLVLALIDDLEEERVQDFLQYLQERLIHILPDHPGPNPHLEVLYQYELHTSPAQTLGYPDLKLSSEPYASATLLPPRAGPSAKHRAIASAKKRLISVVLAASILVAIFIVIAWQLSISRLPRADRQADVSMHHDEIPQEKLSNVEQTHTRPSHANETTQTHSGASLASSLSSSSAPTRTPGIAISVSWKQQVAEKMLIVLQRWKKDGPLTKFREHSGTASSWSESYEKRLTYEHCRSAPHEVIERFFYVLSQQPVQHLLREETITWEGKFVSLLPKEPWYLKKSPDLKRISEKELEDLLEELSKQIISWAPSPPLPSKHNGILSRYYNSGVGSKSIELVDKIGVTFSFERWKMTLHQLGPNFPNSNDPLLTEWVHSFISTADQAATDQKKN